MLFNDDEYFEETEFAELLLTDGDEAYIRLKEDEQEKRKQAQSNSSIEKVLKNIAGLPIDDKLKDLYRAVAQQSNFFKNPEGYRKLIPFIAVDLQCAYAHDTRVKFYQSSVEADLTIKTLGTKLLNDGAESLLIMSDDTDYYVLFGDTENVYCRGISRNTDKTFSAISVFRNLFGEHYSYDYVVRLSALLGNDYTVHERIVAAENVENILVLFGFRNNKRINTLMNLRGPQKIKNVIKEARNSKIVERVSSLNGHSVSIVDTIIRNYDVDYFKRYAVTVLTYKNIEQYANEYREITVTDETNRENFSKLQEFVKATFGTLYTWKYANSIYDKVFVNSIAELEPLVDLYEKAHKTLESELPELE
jgi:hypothetical protein